MKSAAAARIKAKRNQAWRNEVHLITTGGKDRRRKYWSGVFERLTEKGWRWERRDVMRARKAMIAD